MTRTAPIVLVCIAAGLFAFPDADPKSPSLAGKKSALQPSITGLKNPESVAISVDGRIFVTQIGEFDKDGDGSVVVLKDGKATPFATGLNDPKGIVAWQQYLFVTDKNRLLRIDPKGKVETFIETRAFPSVPKFLNDVTVDPTSGTLFVTDSAKGSGTIYRIDQRRRVSKLVDHTKDKRIVAPNGLSKVGEYHLHVVDFETGDLLQVRIMDGEVTKLAEGFIGGDGVAYDYFGRIYVSSWTKGEVHVLPRPGEKPVLLASGFQSAADLCLSQDGKSLLVPDMKAGTLTPIPTTVPGQEVDDSRLPVKIVPAFPDLEWSNWEGVTPRGKIVPHRPIALTHANDGSGRVFVATQHGVIHAFPNDSATKKTQIFLDLQDRVKYNDATNEEGFLGLAFHPKFKANGEFFVFYTPKKPNLVNVVSRFRVSKEDPNRADPASEERLLTFKKPFWNHDGGTICFGPDGYLYVTHGDGGAANDPFRNGQKMTSLLGKILRIDVDNKSPGLPYAIPKDNPFVGTKGVLPEIWAYGFRNVWRMAFDSKSGRLWAGDVGQNLWEEIDLVEKGGNYGWNPREGFHPFGVFGRGSVGPNKDMIDPIWEYHHDVGKSITGGVVYRGRNVPALEGLYLYADYVSGNVWALRYDEEKKRVTANHEIRKGGFPVFSFGEDDKGEVYLLTSTPTGKGLFRFEQVK